MVQVLYRSLQEHGVLNPLDPQSSKPLGCFRGEGSDAFLYYDFTGAGFYWVERPGREWNDAPETRRWQPDSDMAFPWNRALTRAGHELMHPSHRHVAVKTVTKKIPVEDTLLQNHPEKDFALLRSDHAFGFGFDEIMS